MSRRVLARVLPQVRRHAPPGARIEGVLVTPGGFSLPVAHVADGTSAGEPGTGCYVAYRDGAEADAMSAARWRSLVASGTAWIVTDEHVELAPPASTAARALWPDLRRPAAP